MTPTIELTPQRLAVKLPGLHRAASWALVGGGICTTRAVLWQQVRNSDLGPEVDPTELLADHIRASQMEGAIGLMTSAPVSDYTTAIAEEAGVQAMCVATVGLSNALAVGDPPSLDVGPRAGTINLVIWVSVRLSDAALLEALSIATEARTCAVASSNVPSTRSQLPATGTGTDCIVVAAPTEGQQLSYAGKHTAVGSVVGQCAAHAVTKGIGTWRERRSKK